MVVVPFIGFCWSQSCTRAGVFNWSPNKFGHLVKTFIMNMFIHQMILILLQWCCRLIRNLQFMTGKYVRKICQYRGNSIRSCALVWICMPMELFSWYCNRVYKSLAFLLNGDLHSNSTAINAITLTLRKDNYDTYCISLPGYKPSCLKYQMW